MAISPVPRSALPTTSDLALLKERTLSISTKPLPGATASPMSSSSDDEEDTGDLAERMNVQVRNKYVKGTAKKTTMTFQTSLTSAGKRLGEGTYAEVFKAHLASNPAKFVAIKKIKIKAEFKDGITMDAIREVKALQEISHPNIISLLAVFTTKDQNMNLVLEFLPNGDLKEMIQDQNIRYTPADVKAWMGMICRGIWFCHENFILHRDLKPDNLLIAADGEVKIADFGLARSFADPYQKMTPVVITQWYRPPELLYRARYYSGNVDVWSIGCIFAELVLRRPFLPGMTDMESLKFICEAIGTPTEQNWPGVALLPDYKLTDLENAKPLATKREWSQRFVNLSSEGVDLMMEMLTLDPNKRITAKGALQHKWWSVNPKPSRNEHLPKKGGGELKMGDDMKRAPGGLAEEDKRLGKVARKLDFASMAK